MPGLFLCRTSDLRFATVITIIELLSAPSESSLHGVTQSIKPKPEICQRKQPVYVRERESSEQREACFHATMTKV